MSQPRRRKAGIAASSSGATARHRLRRQGRREMLPPNESSPSRAAPRHASQPSSPGQNRGYSRSGRRQQKPEIPYLRPATQPDGDQTTSCPPGRSWRILSTSSPRRGRAPSPFARGSRGRSVRVAIRSTSGWRRRRRGRGSYSRQARRLPSVPGQALSIPAVHDFGSRAPPRPGPAPRRRPRPRPDQAHVSAEDVDELRELVKVPPLEDPAPGPGQVRVVVLEQSGMPRRVAGARALRDAASGA